MKSMEHAETLSARLNKLCQEAEGYFKESARVDDFDTWNERDGKTAFWDRLPQPLKEKSSTLVEELMAAVGLISEKLRTSTLGDEADRRDLTMAAKTMRAALLLRHYRHWETRVLSDEDMVLGVHPAGQDENVPLAPPLALSSFI